jgi:predicted  nucleic acid-binding Zn-ribbon protein
MISTDPSVLEPVGGRGAVRGAKPGRASVYFRDLATGITSNQVTFTVKGAMERIALEPAAITRGIGETEELLAARALASETATAARDARATQRDLDQQADALRAKIGPLEAKLYGGSVRNPKELSDLQADIDQLKRQLSHIEDQDLDALSAAEEREGEAGSAKAELEVLEAAWNAEQADLRNRIAVLHDEIDREDKRRADQAADIAAATLRDYDRLRKARSGRALARLDRNLCLGCRISLPQNAVTRVRSGTAIVHCPNCERMLVP